MTTCETCKGTGLISTGAVAHNLEDGRTETCAGCGGTGATSEEAIMPKPGDPCLTHDDRKGQLMMVEGRLICQPFE